ncbi:membrane protein, putative [Pseudooceanicola batsensis HTCC2597]|uniref:Protoporphyrinogen IX oxidase n=1 Tax=Pseudooceanicola batsensis (strain ATCC BAA-863 / DSM 15984 / KCTC 12145 / HTCC2597) TaxID=252305 RepID=A3TXU3_PSEBH|nr:CopD family protein [Pseudooceanicola batsensis]EAQ02977.1 membrane protein, putative [Pseudooceanicola batsensis HTCC2597]
MTDLLATLYPWTKAIHIIAVIAWMAGLFYLPRLYVHHVEQSVNAQMEETFRMMEKKLLRVIMAPAMIATWLFGLTLVFTPGIVDWTMVWPWTKGAAVIAMTWFHMWLGLRRKALVKGTDTVTGRQYRMMNEVPTLLLIVIVLSVVIKF